MSQLTKLVEFLDRDDVTEVVVATGRPVTVRVGGEYRALGRSPASLAQLDALFAGSPLADLIAGGGGGVDRMRLAERDCAVDVQVHGEQLMIRLTRPRTAAPPAEARARGVSSGPVVIAAAPLPRTHSGDNPPMGSTPPVTPLATGTSARAVDVSGSRGLSRSGDGDVATRSNDDAATAVVATRPDEAPAAAATGSSDDFDGLLSRSSDGGPGPARDGDRSGAVPLANPVNVRKRPITMPPLSASAMASSDPGVVERTAVPVIGDGPAASRHSIELPPADPTASVQVIPTATAPPRVRTPAPAAAAPSVRTTIQSPPPVVVPPAVPPLAASAPAAAPAPLTPTPAVAPTVTPAVARRHTITAAPAIAPLPPLVTGKARATPELLAILAGARGRNASDLHLTGDRPPMERSVRGLEPVGPVLAMADVERMLTTLLSPTQRADLDARGYVDTALDVDGAGRLRANISRFRGGVKGSFRLVLSSPPTLEQLGLPRELGKVTSYHQGLVVIAGPNGHGKTTTLGALVDLINTHQAHHILTIEDPVEIIHPRKKAVISQREVGNHTRSFAAALKASLREDPDVIVIGELRDRETVEIALTAAETGHLVMATMSTPSAAKSLDRLIDMFPADDQQQVRVSLAAALKFVVAQRLLPTVDGTGVVAAVELLTGVLPLAALIRDNKLFQVGSLQQRGRSFGMIRLDDSLVELVRAGRISEDVAIRAADNKKDLTIALRGPAQPPPTTPASRSPVDIAKRGISGIFGAGRRGE